MGYESDIGGDGIAFSRPLNGAETRALRKVFSGTGWASYLLRLAISEKQIDTTDGVLNKVECWGIEPYQSGKAGGLQDDLEKILISLPEDVTAFGYIERIGEQFPDAERLHAVDRKIVSVKAAVTWPEP